MSVFQIPFSQYDLASELSEDESGLLEAARLAGEGAYAPYSGFQVGCAVLLENGEIIMGSNQENKAYPSGICAERTALFYAGASGKAEQIKKIAIRGRSESRLIDQPVTPCGACRQVMLEYEQLAKKNLVVLMQGESGPILRLEGVAESLLPFGFNIDF